MVEKEPNLTLSRNHQISQTVVLLCNAVARISLWAFRFDILSYFNCELLSEHFHFPNFSGKNFIPLSRRVCELLKTCLGVPGASRSEQKSYWPVLGRKCGLIRPLITRCA